MRLALPDETIIEEFVILYANISEQEFNQFFPVTMAELPTLAEPEPSKGALIQLDSGYYLAVIYGIITKRLSVYKPPEIETQTVLEALLKEVKLPLDRVICSDL